MEEKIRKIENEMKKVIEEYQIKLNKLLKDKHELLFYEKEILYIADHYVTNDYSKFLNYCLKNKVINKYKTYLDNEIEHKININ